MSTPNALLPHSNTRTNRHVAFAALVLLLFAECFSSVPGGLRETAVLLSGALGAGILGYAGTGAIQSGLMATLYIVTGIVGIRTDDGLALAALALFVYCFFVFVAIAEAVSKFKACFFKENIHATQLKHLFYASIFLLCVLCLTTLIPLDVRLISLFVCGGVASLLLGYYAQETMYAALCVAAFMTTGFCLACISRGWWWGCNGPGISLYAVFSIVFFNATLLILIGKKFGSTHITNTNRDLHDCEYAFSIKYILLAAFTTALIFASTPAVHVRESGVVLIGIILAVILGCLKRKKLYVALGISLYLTLTLSLASQLLRYGYISSKLDKISILFCMSYLAATLFAHAGLLYRDQILAMHSTAVALCRHRKKRWMALVCVAVLSSPVLALSLLQVDIKFVNISFLVCIGIVAFVLGYQQKEKLHTTVLLTVALTILVQLPRHFVERTALKGSIVSGTGTLFAAFFIVLLGLMFLGSLYKRMEARLPIRLFWQRK